VTTFGQDMTTWLSYSLNQVIGPSITGKFIAILDKNEDLTGEQNSFNGFLTGVHFTYFVSSRTEILMGGTYEYQYYTADREHDNVWTGRLELSYHFTDTLIGRLLYQYQNRNTNIHNNSYYENMFTVTISKFFP